MFAAAYGAHGLTGITTSATALKIYETAQQFHALHSVALLGIAGLLAATEGWRGALADWALRISAGAFVLGILAFCGGIYFGVITGAHTGLAIVPVGRNVPARLVRSGDFRVRLRTEIFLDLPRALGFRSRRYPPQARRARTKWCRYRTCTVTSMMLAKNRITKIEVQASGTKNNSMLVTTSNHNQAVEIMLAAGEIMRQTVAHDSAHLQI